MVRIGWAGSGEARPGMAGNARPGEVGRGAPRHGWRGELGSCGVWQGEAGGLWNGESRQGLACSGKVWLGRLGGVRLCRAWQCTVR